MAFTCNGVQNHLNLVKSGWDGHHLDWKAESEALPGEYQKWMSAYVAATTEFTLIQMALNASKNSPIPGSCNPHLAAVAPPLIQLSSAIALEKLLDLDKRIALKENDLLQWRAAYSTATQKKPTPFTPAVEPGGLGGLGQLGSKVEDAAKTTMDTVQLAIIAGMLIGSVFLIKELRKD